MGSGVASDIGSEHASSEFQTDDHGTFTSFAVEQTAIEAFPTLRRHRIAIGLYNQVEGRLVRTERIETDVRGASTPIPELLDHRQPDLVLLNDDDLTYAKIRLDERSFATLLESIATFDESLPRALCWGSAWDMTRDAELPSSDFVALVLAGVGSETDLTAVGALLRQGQSAVNLFTSDAARPSWPNGGSPASAPWWRRPSPAATTSSHSSAPTPRPRPGPGTCARSSTAASTASASTSTCVGRW